MKKNLLEIYALAVCFVTVICFAIALGVGAYDIIQIKKPEFTLTSYNYERYQSNEAFMRDCNTAFNNDCTDKVNASEEKITEKRLESYQRVLRIEQRNAVRSLTMVSIIIFIDLVLFLIHWRIAKSARLSAASEME